MNNVNKTYIFGKYNYTVTALMSKLLSRQIFCPSKPTSENTSCNLHQSKIRHFLLRLMSPDIDTNVTVIGLQHTSLKCEERKICKHHHITCQDTPSGGLGHHTWTSHRFSVALLPDTLNFSSIRTTPVLCQVHLTHTVITLKGCNSVLPTEKVC